MRGAVHQIPISNDPNIPYFLRVDWSGDLGAGFTIVLTNGSAAWTGEVSEEEVTNSASNTGMPREKYVEELHQVLIQHEKEREGTKYSFQLTADHLLYQRISDNASVNLGSVELQPAPDPLEVNREMIGQSLKRHLHLEATNSQLLQENRKLRCEHKQILQQLSTSVKTKNVLEKQMHSRFVKMVNDKKSRIRELQAEVRTLQQTSNQPKAKTRRQRDPVSDDSGSPDTKEDQSYPEPTILITGRNLVCHGIPVDPSCSSEASQQSD